MNNHEFKIVNTSTSLDKVEIKVSSEGSYQLPYETVTIHLPTTEKRQVYVNGKLINASQPYSLTLFK